MKQRARRQGFALGLTGILAAAGLGASWVGAEEAAPACTLSVEPGPGEAGPMDEVEACRRRNEPKQTLKSTLHLTQVDSDGNPQECRVRVYQKRFERDGFEHGQMKMRLKFADPPYLRKTEYVLHQAQCRCSDGWIYRDRRSRRMPCGGGGAKVPCTDFSGDDLRRRYHMNDPGRSERQPDTRLYGRDAFVLVTYPQQPGEEASESCSAREEQAETEPEYDRIVSYLDQETCVVLREEAWNSGDLVKVLTSDPDSIKTLRYIHYPESQRLDDCFAYEHTMLRLEEPLLDCKIASNVFDEKSMGKSIKRPRCD